MGSATLRLECVIRTCSLIAAVLLHAAAGCGSNQPIAPADPGDSEPVDEAPPSLQSNDILEREPLANRVEVRHLLIGWRDLAEAYKGDIDPRAQARSSDEAEKFTQALYERIKAGDEFEALMAEHSEDRASAQSGTTIEVTPDAPLVLDFKRLSLRLEVGEVGIVQSPFGWHIIKRVS